MPLVVECSVDTVVLDAADCCSLVMVCWFVRSEEEPPLAFTKALLEERAPEDLSAF